MAVLVGATGNVNPRVLAMAKAVVARAGYTVGTIDSGFRPGSRVAGTGAVSLHSHNPSDAVDIGATGAKLTKLGQAALELAGVANPRNYTHWEGENTPGGWEILFHTQVGGNHETHLHLGWRGGAVSSSPLPNLVMPGGRYQFRDLMLLWVGNGGRRDQAAMAAQVALFESGGRPTARLKTSREDSRGLWQINLKAHPTYAHADLYDPVTNVRAAIAISGNGANWSPWSTAGRARAALKIRGPVTVPDVSRPGGGGGGIPGAGAVTGAAGAVAGVVGSGADAVWNELRGIVEWGTALVKLIGFIVDPKNWLRLVEFLVGSSLVLLGLAVLVAEFAKKDTPAGGAARGIVKAASAFTPEARAFRGFRRATGQTRSVRDRQLARKMRPRPVYRVPSSSSQNTGPGEEGIPF